MLELELNIHDFHKCGKFAKSIVEKENQFNRMNEPDGLRRFRTFLGKTGELYIHKYNHFLKENNFDNFIYINEMFEIYPGITNVDEADFLFKNLTVDIKTIYASNHKNIVIPTDQPIKDIYIGVKVHTNNEWLSNDFHKKSENWGKNTKAMFRDITKFSCLGFIEREKVETCQIKSEYGNSAYFVPLNLFNKNPNELEKILSSLVPARQENKQKILVK